MEVGIHNYETEHGFTNCTKCGMSEEEINRRMDDGEDSTCPDSFEPSEAQLEYLYDTSRESASERQQAAWKQHQELHR